MLRASSEIALRTADDGNGTCSIATASSPHHTQRRRSDVGIGRWKVFCVMVTGFEYEWLSVGSGMISLTATSFLPRCTP